MLTKIEDNLWGCKGTPTKKNCSSAKKEGEKETCLSCKPGYYFEGENEEKECVKIDVIAKCTSGNKANPEKKFNCNSCEPGHYVENNSCVEVTKEKLITGCSIYKFLNGNISCSVCSKDYYETNDDKQCKEDKVKTMCFGNGYEKLDNLDTCNSCASARGYFAVNVHKTTTKTRQVCLKGNGADPDIPTDGNKKIMWIIISCVGGMVLIGLIIWLIVKSKSSENDDLYDSMISNGPI